MRMAENSANRICDLYCINKAEIEERVTLECLKYEDIRHDFQKYSYKVVLAFKKSFLRNILLKVIPLIGFTFI